MKQNVGTLDRAARGMISVFTFLWAMKKPNKFRVAATFDAGMLMSSTLSGYCPLYELLGINTVGKPL
jgi:hypothetical protein